MKQKITLHISSFNKMKLLYYSFKIKDNLIATSGRHEVQTITKTQPKGHHTAHPNFNFKVKMVLTIRNITKQDVGTYKCVAKNSNGEFESTIRLYGKFLIQYLLLRIEY